MLIGYFEILISLIAITITDLLWNNKRLTMVTAYGQLISSAFLSWNELFPGCISYLQYVIGLSILIIIFNNLLSESIWFKNKPKDRADLKQ